jgi:hypothetical protein
VLGGVTTLVTLYHVVVGAQPERAAMAVGADERSRRPASRAVVQAIGATMALAGYGVGSWLGVPADA